METTNFYGVLYRKTLQCANSLDLSDDVNVLYDIFIVNEEKIAMSDFEEFFDSKRQLTSFSSQDVDETS